MAKIEFSKKSHGTCGIVGHAGCGHVNSHLGFIQDDSGGLSAVIRLLQRFTHLDLTITSVVAKTGLDNAYFEVTTKSRGVGKAFARRGITEHELRLAQFSVGKEAVNSQAIVAQCFGRVLGQGAMEVPVALQTAIANASMDSFVKSFPDRFLYGDEEIEGNCGKILGTVLTVDGFDTSVLALSNASIGGVGPNEDIEGNVNLYGKKEMMHSLKLDNLPSIVIEGKVCAEPLSPYINEPTFLIRGNIEDDNPVVANCLFEASKILGFPAEYRGELLKRSSTAMAELTRKQADYLLNLAKSLSTSTTASEKVAIAAEFNRFCSEELGGITFMSEDIHQVMGGVGCIPGTSCVLSLFIPTAQLKRDVQPSLTLDDVDRYVDLCVRSVPLINKEISKADACLRKVKRNFNIE